MPQIEITVGTKLNPIFVSSEAGEFTSDEDTELYAEEIKEEDPEDAEDKIQKNISR